MPNTTTNYGLTKPLPEEFYDIGVMNSNMDTIDKELNRLASNTGLPVINARGSNFNMDEIIRSGVHLAMYETDTNTLGTPYKHGKSDATAASILSCGNDTDYAMQVAFTAGGEMLMRRLGTGTLGTWNILYHQGYVPTAVEVGAVAKSGDTMTGGLNLPNMTVYGEKMNALLAADPSRSRFNIMAFENGTNKMSAFTITPDGLYLTNDSGADHTVIHTGNLKLFVSAGVIPATVE